jgi:nucleotide-binding universal stress UspA family protein
MGMSKVVVGYDPSDRAKQAFEAGVELALALGAEIHLVSGYSDGPGGQDGVTPQRQQAEELLEQAAAGISHPEDEVHRYAIPRAPAAAILEVATEIGADVIVIGNRGAQGKARVLGSVASAVLGRTPCNVFVVRTG